jgi:hypothetical protein
MIVVVSVVVHTTKEYTFGSAMAADNNIIQGRTLDDNSIDIVVVVVVVFLCVDCLVKIRTKT